MVEVTKPKKYYFEICTRYKHEFTYRRATMLREQIQKFCETEYDFYKREEVVKSEDDFDTNACHYLQNKVGYQCLSEE